jgi:hypothetical protein
MLEEQKTAATDRKIWRNHVRFHFKYLHKFLWLCCQPKERKSDSERKIKVSPANGNVSAILMQANKFCWTVLEVEVCGMWAQGKEVKVKMLHIKYSCRIGKIEKVSQESKTEKEKPKRKNQVERTKPNHLSYLKCIFKDSGNAFKHIFWKENNL